MLNTSHVSKEKTSISLNLAKNEESSNSEFGKYASRIYTVMSENWYEVRSLTELSNSILQKERNVEALTEKCATNDSMVIECPFLKGKMNIISDPEVMKTISNFHRRDTSSEGLFSNEDQPFMDLYKFITDELFPNDKDKITINDLILTADKEFVKGIRSPLVGQMAPHQIKKKASEIQSIAEMVIDNYTKQSSDERISGHSLSIRYMLESVFRLVIGHVPSNDYENIVRATEVIYGLAPLSENTFISFIKGLFARPKAMTIYREAIEAAFDPDATTVLDSLVDKWRSQNKTDAQIKVSLFMLLTPIPTATQLLNYTLWQLGRNPEFQKQVRDAVDPDEVNKMIYQFFAESIRIFNPTSAIQRLPGADLVITKKNADGEIIKQEFMEAKNSVVYTPYFAARDGNKFKDPHQFNPHRDHTELSWLPFGHGRHKCPAHYLVETLITTFIKEIIQKFEIKSFPEKDDLTKKVTPNSGEVLKVEEEVLIQLTPINANFG